MASAFDARLVEVEIIVNGQKYSFSGDYAIYASGIKFGSDLQNSCELTIYNLTRDMRNTILTLTSPLIDPSAPSIKRLPVVMNLSVGRESYGKFLLFTGNVISSNITQPPDIGISLVSLTNNFFLNTVMGLQLPAVSQLSEIAKNIADTMGLYLDFEATDKQIGNFSVTGAPAKWIEKLNEMGGIQAGIDNDTLYVIDADKARRGEDFIINQQSGMVGIPQVTEQGVLVRTMINNILQIGGSVTIDSTMNPAANGKFKIVQMRYDVASRDQPFFYTLLCSNLALYQGSGS